jgi:hypothetical protein
MNQFKSKTAIKRCALVAVAVVVVGLVSGGAAVAASWKVQAIPRAVKAGLSAVSCSSARACTAVGGHLALRSNGMRWSVERTAKPGASVDWTFSGVSCPSRTTCIAVGSSGGDYPSALAERWDGSRWHVIPVPTPGGAQDSFLSAVSCTSASACTAVGEYDPADGPYSLALVERWNGSTWSMQPTPVQPAPVQPTPQSASVLYAVTCTSQTLCTAVGANFQDDPIALRWRDGQWSLDQAPPSLGFLDSVSCPSPSGCMVVGAFNAGDGAPSFAVAAKWDGTRWTILKPPHPYLLGGLGAITCRSPRACVALADVGAVAWNGSRWSVQRIPNANVLNGLSCPSKTVCVAVGALYSGAGSGYGPIVERRS